MQNDSEFCHRNRMFVPGLLVLLLLWPAAAVGQAEEGEEDLEVFVEHLNVDVVNVDVYVTNRKGEPIHGLSAADFQLLEDGNPLPLTNFYAVEGGAIRTDEEEPVRSPEAPVAPVEAAPAPLPPEQRLNAVLFIDNLNLSPPMRSRVMRDLRPFVGEQLRAGDRLMVVAFDREVEIVQRFTDDPELLTAALDQISEKGAMSGAAFQLERQGILRDIAEAQLPASPGSGAGQRSAPSEAGSFAVSEAASILSSIETYAQRHQNQTFVTLGALSRLVDTLAGLPGRKAVVYVSEGLSLRPGETLYRAWENKFLTLRDPEIGPSLNQMISMTSNSGSNSVEFNVESAFQRLAEQASAQRVTFYGLRPSNPLAITAAQGTFDFGALDTAGGGQAYTAGLASLDAANRGGSMRLLADVTGGFAITNAGAFRVALDRLAGDFSSFYSLGYTPSRARDERKHKIEVRVTGREGAVVRHRTKYQDRDRGSEMRQMTLASLHYGEGGNPLAVQVDVAESMDAETDGQRRVPVLVKVPMSNLTLLPRDNDLVGLLSIHVAARDQQGRTSPIRSVKVPIRIARADLLQAAGREAGHHFLLEMYHREHEVTVGVRDEIGDVESFTVVEAAP